MYYFVMCLNYTTFAKRNQKKDMKIALIGYGKMGKMIEEIGSRLTSAGETRHRTHAEGLCAEEDPEHSAVVRPAAILTDTGR